MTVSYPRPSKLFAAVSALVIAGVLFVLSALVAVNVVEPNLFVIMGGLFAAPGGVLLAVQQYRGTFRRVAAAAAMTSMLLYILGGFLIFVVIAVTGDAVVDGISLRLLASTLIYMSVAALGSIVWGRLNALWARKLRAALATGAAPPLRVGVSGRELLLAVGVMAAMTGVAVHIIRTAPPRYAENIDAAAAPFDLPPGAADVSYGQGYRGTLAYEFTIDESGFRVWVNAGIGSAESQSAGVPLLEITSPFTIRRYYAYTPERNGPLNIAINHGLCYSWSQEDRGVYAAYDRDTGRAYYHAHFH